MDDKSLLKGVWSGSRDLFKPWGPSDIIETADARVIKFYTQVDYIICQLTDDLPSLEGAWSWLHDPFQF